VQVSAASLAGLGNYVSKGPSAAAGVLESIGSGGGAGAAGVGKRKGAGVASTALAAAGAPSRAGMSTTDLSGDCPRCVQRAQMHLQRALANGDTGLLIDGRRSEN
jgi:hypothetical protein